MSRILSLFLTLALACPAPAHALRSGSGIDDRSDAKNSVRAGLEERLKKETAPTVLIVPKSAAGVEETPSPLPAFSEFLRRLPETERTQLLTAVTGEGSETDRVRSFLGIIHGSKIFDEMTSKARMALLNEISRPRSYRWKLRRWFLNERAILAHLRLVDSGLLLDEMISVDRKPSERTEDGEETDPPLSKTLLEALSFQRLLRSDERQLLNFLFERIFVEGADALPAEDYFWTSASLRRIFGGSVSEIRFAGRPEIAGAKVQKIGENLKRNMQIIRVGERAFTVQELIRAYPETESFLLFSPEVPLAIANRVRGDVKDKPDLVGEATLRIAEVEDILKLYREQAGSQRPLPETLSFWRETLRQNPVPRLVRSLPDLGDPSALWNPLQIEFLERYGRARVEASFRDAGQLLPPPPPWGHDAGGQDGASEFELPPEVQAKLEGAKTFLERLFILAGAIPRPDGQRGLQDYELARLIGADPGVVRSWRIQGTEEPQPGLIPACACAVRAHPIYLLAGLPVEEAMQRDRQGRVIASVGERMRLWLRARGLTQGQAAERLDVHLATVTRNLTTATWQRSVLREWSLRLGLSFSLLETGWESTYPLFTAPVQVGFRSGAPPPGVVVFASLLERALVEEWQRQERADVMREWAAQIAPDPVSRYSGLAVRLLMAYPGTIRRMVHYGMIPKEGADLLLEWGEQRLRNLQRVRREGARTSPLPSEDDMAEGARTLARHLAGPLARAHDELEGLFQTAPPYRPPEGYPSGSRGRGGRVQGAWDLVAWGLSRAQIVAVSNKTNLAPGTLKMRVFLNPSPEGVVLVAIGPERIKRIQAKGKFRDLSEEMIGNYLLTSPVDPERVLGEAVRSRKQLLELSGRGWILPVTPKGKPVSPEAFANSLLRRRIFPARKVLERFDQRDRALQQSLLAPEDQPLRQLAADMAEMARTQGWGADFPVPDDPGMLSEDPDFLTGLTILHRVVAHRQISEQGFLREATPEAAHAVIQQVTALLQQVQEAGQFPQSAEQLEQLIREIAAGLTAGLEEPAVRVQEGIADVRGIPARLERWTLDAGRMPPANVPDGVQVYYEPGLLPAGLEEALRGQWNGQPLSALVLEGLKARLQQAAPGRAQVLLIVNPETADELSTLSWQAPVAIVAVVPGAIEETVSPVVFLSYLLEIVRRADDLGRVTVRIEAAGMEERNRAFIVDVAA